MVETEISSDRPCQDHCLLRDEGGPQQICLKDADMFQRCKFYNMYCYSNGVNVVWIGGCEDVPII